MVQENPVYYKLDYSESLNCKKQVLFSQIHLLNLLKIVKRYRLLKNEEYKIKSKIHRNIKEIEILLNKTSSLFPFVKLSKKIKRQNIQKSEKIDKAIKFNDNLEDELEQIQRKLKELENK